MKKITEKITRFIENFKMFTQKLVKLVLGVMHLLERPLCRT